MIKELDAGVKTREDRQDTVTPEEMGASPSILFMASLASWRSSLSTSPAERSL